MLPGRQVRGRALPAQTRRFDGAIWVNEREVHVCHAVDVPRSDLHDNRFLLSEHFSSLPNPVSSSSGGTAPTIHAWPRGDAYFDVGS